ncbi:Ethanolamine kinase 1 [Schistosoma japonicum]|uniref:ethanolamine kinase n=1 Tax=Schistosoma japonicum TaxID=6182 RepID=A0A4Z2CUE2_SCHJA|nr:Ethanolamine kinase 1 [Schistosoma japonicum]
MAIASLLPDSIPIFDIRVLSDKDEENIWKILKIIFPTWLKEYTKVQTLEEGLSNIVIRFDYDNQKEENKTILMRIRRKLADYITNRWDEIKHMYILRELGHEQELYGIFQNGLVYSFIKGSTINVDNFSVLKYSELIIDQLARLHSLPTKETMQRLLTDKSNNGQLCTKPVLLPTIRNWIENLPTGYSDKKKSEKLENEFPSKAFLLKELLHMYSRFLMNQTVLLLFMILKYYFIDKEFFYICIPFLSVSIFICIFSLLHHCHHKESVHFIDFEYCGFNHAAFDIGNHFCEFAGIDVKFDKYPTIEYQQMWISRYLKAKNYYERQFNRKEISHDGFSSTTAFNVSSSYSTNSNDQDHHNNNCDNESLLEKWLIEVNNFALSAHLFWGVWAVVLSIQEENKFDYLSYGISRMNQYYIMKEHLIKTTLGS